MDYGKKKSSCKDKDDMKKGSKASKASKPVAKMPMNKKMPKSMKKK